VNNYIAVASISTKYIPAQLVLDCSYPDKALIYSAVACMCNAQTI